jgi:hypothetical protein
MSSGPLYLPAAFDDVPHVAVCAGRNGRFIHAGIVYRNNAGQRMMLDIDLNGDISAGTVQDKQAERFAWAIPDFPEMTLQAFAAYCDFLSIKAPNVGYAFKTNQTTMLVVNGHDMSLVGATGLTCATFVLIAFRSHFMELVDLSTWTHRADDEQFQRDILKAMRQRIHDPRFYGITQDRVDAAENQIPSLRCRPEEVLGACRVGSHPANMPDCEAAGEECMRWLDQTLQHLA